MRLTIIILLLYFSEVGFADIAKKKGMIKSGEASTRLGEKINRALQPSIDVLIS
jgi:hypothetical protein